MPVVPKGPSATATASVSDIGNQRVKRQRGRPSGLGYDPETGQEVAGPTLEPKLGELDPESDIFALIEKRGYSEDRFYIKSSDKQGHSKMIRIWIPQGIQAQVYEAISKVPHYRSVQDFVRDALVHRLEFTQHRYAMSDQARRAMELERMMADQEHRKAEMETMHESVESLDVTLGEMYEREDWSLMDQEFDQSYEYIDWLRDPYRARAVAVFDKWRNKAKESIIKHRAKREDD